MPANVQHMHFEPRISGFVSIIGPKDNSSIVYLEDFATFRELRRCID
jgi:hypothetical protein